MTQSVEVRTFEEISYVLGSSDFEPIAYADRHARLADALGFDVSEILRAIHAIPLCLRGEAHARTRARLARCVAATAPAIDRFAETDLKAMVAGLLTPGQHDVMAEMVLPCVDQIIGCTIGMPITTDPDAMVSRLSVNPSGSPNANA